MKKILFYSVLLILAACKKEEETPIELEPWWATSGALKNDKVWVTNSTFASLNQQSNELLISVATQDYFYKYNKEDILFRYIPNQEGTYKLIEDAQKNGKPVVGLLFRFADGDVVSTGTLIEKAENELYIDQIDAQTREIKGRFQVTFYDKNTNDTLRYTKGVFHTRYNLQ